MNTPNTHTQLPENLIVVDREWFEKKMKYNSFLQNVWEPIIENSYSLTPILYNAFKDGNLVRKDIDVNEALAEYILLPIILKRN